ncbi:molybdopterin molybdotransferase MoeA [Nonomuraea soli]|uniref:Molybdopterin molybdenumtransferase n=1 Tax=Nonomuraea soli TaxID=1032476 RepID=A0A7W0CDG9_9ACTN|nr:molybdopterin molybdotransferase MoeA [Nonomuraea soli]MBA2889155.1 molybdopterin molybdotransferase [Nonomuraea soli]
MSWAEAREAAVAAGAALTPVAVEVPLAEAYGCRLAAPLRALVALPGVDVAAMDGYAVAGEGPWRVAGHVLAGGEPYQRPLPPGACVEIATGAPVPRGADRVVPYEHTSRGENTHDQDEPAHDRRDQGEDPRGRPFLGAVVGEREPSRRPHIRRRGEDVERGAVVLGAGAEVTPVVLALAAGLGHDTLPVRPRPNVAVLVTGDEVVHEGLPRHGRVRDAIGPFLPGLVEWAGGRVSGRLRLPDGREALARALTGWAVRGEGRWAPKEADVLVVCGASSKGPADHLRAVLAELGAEVLVDGVAVRPGHPQLLARLPGAGPGAGPFVVGLPGNPFAALGAAMTLLVPLLRGPSRQLSALAGPVRAHARDTRLVPVRRTGRGAVPIGHDGPASLWGAALADALAVVPPGWDGEQAELLELPRKV